jgi:hypothetical protein
MRDFREEDKAVRSRLEKQSSGGARLNMADRLNRMAAGDARQGLPGLAAYLLLRGIQARGRDIDRRYAKHDRLMAAGKLGKGEGEPLDRLHPSERAKSAHGPNSAAAGRDRIHSAQIAAAELRRRYW